MRERRRRVAVASRHTGAVALLLFGQRCNESSSLAMRDAADVARKIRCVSPSAGTCKRRVAGVFVAGFAACLEVAQRINFALFALVRSVPQTVDGSCLLVMYPAEDRPFCCERVLPKNPQPNATQLEYSQAWTKTRAKRLPTALPATD